MNSISTLTWVLLILAVVVIGGVLLFNVFQERKTTTKAKPTANVAATNTPLPQKAAADGLIETGLDGAGNHFVGNRFEQTSKAEPSIGVLTQYLGEGATAQVTTENNIVQSTTAGDWTSAEHAAALAQASSAEVAQSGNVNLTNAINSVIPPVLPSAPPSVLSDDFDYLLEFALPSLQSGERLIAMTAAHRRAGGKPVAFDGLLSTGQWIMLQPGELYVALRAGLLLANRHGPLNAMEFSDFGNFAQDLAKQLDCEVTLADMPRVLSRAREVDRRCAELDAQLGISIHTAAIVSPAALASAAIEHGLTERGGGRFAKLDDKGGTLFTVSFGEQGDKLAMLLDVPRAPAQQRPWQQMVQCAQSLAKNLNGQLVDDAGKALPDGLWGQIEEQLRQRYWALEGAGIEPGSPRALRLFN
jgi:hypothetical protein